tara:strand:- start:158 stop:379 length:222 start_codon:yes stop_codon:yes gene_type:complete
MTDKKEKGKNKSELEEELALLVESNVQLTEQLTQVSEGYQSLLSANQNLGVLAHKYEETINLLTARLLEKRQG